MVASLKKHMTPATISPRELIIYTLTLHNPGNEMMKRIKGLLGDIRASDIHDKLLDSMAAIQCLMQPHPL
jgi:hypothetical protein